MHRYLLLLVFLLASTTVVQAEQFLYYPFASNFDLPSQYINSYGCPDQCHTGTDYSCPYNTPIYASISGTVTELVDNQPDGAEAPGCTYSAGYGNYITIVSGSRKVRYAHCKKNGFTVAVGQSVVAGQTLIGYTSNSGYTCGSGPNGSYYHLHFEVWLYENGQWNYKDPYQDGLWISPYIYGGSTPHYEIALATSQEGGAQFVDGIQTTEVTMTPGQVAHFTVRYKNKCNFTWSNNPSDPNYVHLMSCGTQGYDVQASFLNNPWNSSLGWTQSPAHVTSFNEGSIAPGVISTFEFDVYIPSGTSPQGPIPVYFSLHHATHGFISTGWGGLSFQVTVPNTSLNGDDFTAFTGDFNGDGKKDIGLWETTTGNWYIAMADQPNKRFIPEAEPWLTGWGSGGGYKLVVADFTGDGYDDICVYHPGTGRWFVAYNQYNSTHHFIPTSGPYSNGSWIEGWATGGMSDWIPMVGRFNSDNNYDIAVMHPSDGRWWVAFNNLTAKRFEQAGSYWLDWGDGSYGTYWPFVGKLDGADNYSDAAVYHPGTGRWFVAENIPGQNTFTSRGLWLDGWATGSAYTWRYFSGKSSTDSYDDVIVYKPAEGKWCVAYNWNGYFQQANGAYNGAWLSGWAVEDGTLNWQTFTADVSGDGWVDLVAYTPKYGRWFVAYNQGLRTPPEFEQSGSDWLDGWGVENGAAKVVGEENIATLPHSFMLYQNYPNPFNPTTVISYSLSEASDVKLDVFNILGQRVTTLINQKQEAGEHAITWDASSVASGVYFYRIQTAEAVETKKMLLLK